MANPFLCIALGIISPSPEAAARGMSRAGSSRQARCPRASRRAGLGPPISALVSNLGICVLLCRRRRALEPRLGIMVPLCLLLALEALAVPLVDEFTERNLFASVLVQPSLMSWALLMFTRTLLKFRKRGGTRMDLSPPSVDVAHFGSQLASGWAELDSASAACPTRHREAGNAKPFI